MLKKIAIGVGVVVVLMVVALYVLLRENPPPENCAFKFDLTQARTLARSMPGPGPREIHVEEMAVFEMPQVAVRAGGAWRKIEMHVYAYQLAYADRTIILDTGLNDAQAREMKGEHFDAAAAARVQKALERAAAIYVTHEHADHLGNIFAGAMPPHVFFTPEQMDSGRSAFIVIDAAVKARVQPLVYEGAVALAPGLVAIKAPGHTPGSQWFFVVREDGRELLFAGDTAWRMMNITDVQGPPLGVSLMLKNDRAANACQLAALKDVLDRTPSVWVMPGHDAGQMDALVAGGAVTKGFMEAVDRR